MARLAQIRIVPVIVIEDAENAEPLARALVEGGIPCAEVTFRTDAAAESIRRMAAVEGMLVGSGTIFTVAQADEAAKAGATFMVTPGFDSAVVRRCQELGVPICPGTATPTDIQAALAHDLSVVKFFPAEAYGGIKTLKTLGGPFPMMRFIPTGGLSPSNVKEYLELPSVIACGGSWIAPPDLIKARRFEEITRIAREAVKLTV